MAIITIGSSFFDDEKDVKERWSSQSSIVGPKYTLVRTEKNNWLLCTEDGGDVRWSFLETFGDTTDDEAAAMWFVEQDLVESAPADLQDAIERLRL